MKPSNQIIYDWISFTTKIHSVNDVLNLLDFRPDTVRFQSSEQGRYFYRKSLYYDGIHIYYDGFSKEHGNMGVCVEMSGKGLRNWEEYGNADYNNLFKLILTHYNDDPDLCRMKLTRLDIAYDDFEGILDLNTIMRDAMDYNYLSRLRNCSINLDMSEGQYTGLTVAHGSMKSNVYIRMYDKRLEQKVSDILEHWIRVEIQLRKENAIGFIMLADSIENSYFSVLNQYLRYLVHSDDSHRERWSTAPYWLNFIRSADSKSIFRKPKNDYKPENLISYVEKQLSGAVATYIDLVGVDNFLVNIYNARVGKPLNPKYKSVLERADSNGAELLNHLKEHGLL
ncbi:MAG: replication initiation factor domain-containing protein [Ruminococcus sp.]|nr:replication initiation factor domain-containing protein [Ruminococcus sp.]